MSALSQSELAQSLGVAWATMVARENLTKVEISDLVR
jgi:DNA-binding XRE family transcriptional regulator